MDLCGFPGPQMSNTNLKCASTYVMVSVFIKQMEKSNKTGNHPNTKLPFPDTVACAYNLIAWEAEDGGSQTQGQSGLARPGHYDQNDKTSKTKRKPQPLVTTADQHLGKRPKRWAQDTAGRVQHLRPGHREAESPAFFPYLATALP